MEPDPIDHLPTMPRPVGVAAGILLLVPALFLAWAGVGVPLLAGRNSNLATWLISLVSLWGAVLCLSTSWRLVANQHRSDGGLVSPLLLRGAGFLFAVLPVAALATGSWRLVKAPPWLLAVQMVSYFTIAITLLRLARKRQSKQPPFPESRGGDEEPGPTAPGEILRRRR